MKIKRVQLDWLEWRDRSVSLQYFPIDTNTSIPPQSMFACISYISFGRIYRTVWLYILLPISWIFKFSGMFFFSFYEIIAWMENLPTVIMGLFNATHLIYITMVCAIMLRLKTPLTLIIILMVSIGDLVLIFKWNFIYEYDDLYAHWCGTHTHTHSISSNVFEKCELLLLLRTIYTADDSVAHEHAHTLTLTQKNQLDIIELIE